MKNWQLIQFISSNALSRQQNINKGMMYACVRARLWNESCRKLRAAFTDPIELHSRPMKYKLNNITRGSVPSLWGFELQSRQTQPKVISSKMSQANQYDIRELLMRSEFTLAYMFRPNYTRIVKLLWKREGTWVRVWKLGVSWVLEVQQTEARGIE